MTADAMACPPPPCELSTDGRPQVAQTYVVKMITLGDEPGLVNIWVKGRLADGAGACACVFLPTAGVDFIVVTEAAAHRVEGRVRALKTGIEQLPGNPGVEWVRPLTRPLQRLFGWGDVLSTKEAVVHACKAGDPTELKALLPQARALIDRGDFEHLPMLHDVLREGMPALADCKHVFYEEPSRFVVLPGPCSRNHIHPAPFTKCVGCGLVCCHRCADVELEEQRARRDEQRAAHDVLGHQWSQEPRKRAECTACNAMPAFECSCGAQRCKRCLKPPPEDPLAPVWQWHEHPTRPQPFRVIDVQKMPEADKLEWIKQELQCDVPLEDFAAKFVELFGGKLSGTVPQKNSCLKLYGLYAEEGRCWEKECDLPPKVQVKFRRVWKASASDRCAECGEALDKPGEYCARKGCAHAGMTNICRCGQVLDNAHPYCGACKRGASPLRGVLSERAQEQQGQMSLLQRLCFGGAMTKDPEHEPAWKRRKRS